MVVEFFDGEIEERNPLHGMRFSDRNQVEALLDGLFAALQHRALFVIKLIAENEYELGIGIGKLGFVQHHLSDGDPPCLLAVRPGARLLGPHEAANPYRAAAREDDSDGAIPPSFLAGGTPTPIPTRYCMPFELVKEIALHFVQSGERSSSISWENI